MRQAAETTWLGAICILWLGFVSAISFMEAPVKFKAPSLTKEVALDVGRTVFAALSKVEMFYSIATFMLLFLATKNGTVPKNPPFWMILAVVWFIVLAQAFILQPILRQRALQIIKHDPVKSTPLSRFVHVAYIVSDMIKVVLLALTGYRLVLLRE